MGKKSKPTPPLTVPDAARLTHSPFAGLSARVPEAPQAPEAASPAHPEPRSAKHRGRLVLRRETKHRGGKAVIVISGFSALPGFDAATIEALAKRCKHELGCGGTVDSDEIVLQGDRAAAVAQLLTAEGFRVAGVTR